MIKRNILYFLAVWYIFFINANENIIFSKPIQTSKNLNNKNIFLNSYIEHYSLSNIKSSSNNQESYEVRSFIPKTITEIFTYSFNNFKFVILNTNYSFDSINSYNNVLKVDDSQFNKKANTYLSINIDRFIHFDFNNNII